MRYGINLTKNFGEMSKMDKAEAEMKIKAAAYAVASELSWQEAVKLLKRVASEIEDAQWN